MGALKPRRMSTEDVIPLEVEEYATALIAVSCRTLPGAVPAASGVITFPAPEAAAII
jgi:hypothetical protein